ncbi:MAG TPA: hypothetical protein DEQ47_09685 [Solibacterales bacterium]|nr:hypothetical protein [Bryobacterales bacterium]
MTTFEAAREEDRTLLRNWPGVAPFLGDELLVAREDGGVVGALAWRSVAQDEREILYIETASDQRRRGIARALLRQLLSDWAGATYLEVRESNQAAQELYRQCGFEAVGRRSAYYSHPVEAAIVLKICS